METIKFNLQLKVTVVTAIIIIAAFINNSITQGWSAWF